MTTALTALNDLLAAAGMPPAIARQADLTGDDPVFPTPYRIAAAGAAAIAAAALASAELWRLRTGRAQRVGVDARAAAASLRGHKYLKVNGVNPQTRDTITRYYQLKDGGWIYLHNNFPHLRERNLRVLGARHEADDVARAVSTWDGPALEEAIFAQGGCCGMVRSAAQWAAHPQGSVVAALPVLEIVRIGDAMPQALPAGKRPLAGVRALDLTRVIAGPFCARVLAEHGADVMKVSRPDLPDSGALDIETGIGKLSTFLDLREAAQAEQLRELVRASDIFVHAYRPGALAARGFGPEDLAQLRPGLVYVTLNAWGHEGPWRERRGFDTVVQAVNGMAAQSAVQDEPRQLPVAAIDYISGNIMAYGAMVALARRATEGGSWMVRVSLAAVGDWIARRGLVDELLFSSARAELPAQLVDSWMRNITAPAGQVRYLGPVASMPETPPGAFLPPLPLGASAPQWP